MSDSFDRKLQLDERLALRGHLLACSACPKLQHQLRVVVQASRRRSNEPDVVDDETGASGSSEMTRDQHLSDDAKDRIKALLSEPGRMIDDQQQ
ncbi:MAG: hypothetical protein KDB00_06795 [Planctomycetales bacterium]|nr:hypothetical protein [Planctomycetales bacterium]